MILYPSQRVAQVADYIADATCKAQYIRFAAPACVTLAPATHAMLTRLKAIELDSMRAGQEGSQPLRQCFGNQKSVRQCLCYSKCPMLIHRFTSSTIMTSAPRIV